MKGFLRNAGRTRRSFDSVLSKLASSETTETEIELLKASHWDLGEDARLREDLRFRKSPWNRWLCAGHILANDSIYSELHTQQKSHFELSTILREFQDFFQRPCVFCPGDSRLILRGKQVWLSADELSNRPLIEEDIGDLQKFTTHLPIHTLKAAAASLPRKEWGPNTQEELIETLGWLEVSGFSRRLNSKMFVAQIQGNSMDNGKNGIVDGAYAVFELYTGGSRNGQDMLIRGSFSDPETGNYAVKRYEGEARDENRERQRITLKSLNNDSENYPDIVVEAEDEHDLSVIARLIEALSPADFARLPKRRRRAGERDLDDEDEQSKRTQSLKAIRSRFFEGELKEASETNDPEESAPTTLVCLAVENGGLAVEVQPGRLILPTFVKRLELVPNGSANIVALVSNLKAHGGCFPIPPATSYFWQVPGFEDDFEEELDPWRLTGPKKEQITVFRVDSKDIGREISSRTFSPNEVYRILLPPEFAHHIRSEDGAADLPEGWKLWELRNPAEGRAEALSTLDLQVGATSPQVRFVGHPPARYETTVKGDIFPVFSECPILEIDGVTTEEEGELRLLISCENEDSMICKLIAGGPWHVELQGLPPGQVALQLLHTQVAIDPVTLLFLFDPTAEALHPALFVLHESDETRQQNPEGLVEREMNLSGDIPEGLSLETSKLWRCAVWWDDGQQRRRIESILSSENGCLSLSDLNPTLLYQVERSTIGVLEISAGELGCLRIVHSRTRTISAIRGEVEQLFEEQGPNLDNLRSHWPSLHRLWLAPLLQTLGYHWQPLNAEHLADAPPDLTGFEILEPELGSDGRVRLNRVRLLVIFEGEQDLNDLTNPNSARSFAETLCNRLQVRRAVLTDGLQWAVHKRKWRFSINVRDLEEDLNGEGFEEFLHDFANFAVIEGG